MLDVFRTPKHEESNFLPSPDGRKGRTGISKRLLECFLAVTVLVSPHLNCAQSHAARLQDMEKRFTGRNVKTLTVKDFSESIYNVKCLILSKSVIVRIQYDGATYFVSIQTTDLSLVEDYVGRFVCRFG